MPWCGNRIAERLQAALRNGYTLLSRPWNLMAATTAAEDAAALSTQPGVPWPDGPVMAMMVMILMMAMVMTMNIYTSSSR